METNQTKDGKILLMVSDNWSLIRIDLSIIITVIAMLLLMVFGYLRRRIHVTWQKYIIQANYAVISSALPYFIGLMTNAPVKLEYFPIWAGFLLLAWGSDGHMTVCSIHELELQALHAWRGFVLSYWFGWLAGTYILDKKINVPLLALFVLIFIKPGEKLHAIEAAGRSNGLVKLARPILDHMKGGIKEDGVHDDGNPSSLRGYPYLVEVHNSSNTVITIDRIWRCQRGILSSTAAASDPRDHGELLKDICLSFALFKLLLRRFVGFPLHESSKQSTWKFVRDGLLSGPASSKSNGYERAFRVIEIELGFLHDLLFTKFYVVAYLRGYKHKLLQFPCIAVCLWFAIFTLADENNRPKALVPGFGGIKYKGHNVEVGITRVAIGVIALFEIIQLCTEFLSNWKIVRLVCGICVAEECRHWTIKDKINDKMIRFILRMKHDVFPSNNLFCFRPWQRKLGQYSLLHSFDYVPFGRSCYRFLLQPFTQLPRNGQSESPAIVLSKDVKITVIESLLETGPRLQNGKSALQRHGLTNLLAQACDFDYLAQTILVWHVATIMCEHLPCVNRSSASNIKQDLHVATSLSNYCAYLVTFAPELLPDNQYLTECQLDTMVEEARREFQGCTTIDNKCQKLRATDSENNIADFNLKYAGLLGTHLISFINEDPDRGWKFLKEFWAELLLFSALSSDNAIAHGDHLVTGGEFITHLWCLLTHAGIINKDSFAP